MSPEVDVTSRQQSSHYDGSEESRLKTILIQRDNEISELLKASSSNLQMLCFNSRISSSFLLQKLVAITCTYEVFVVVFCRHSREYVEEGEEASGSRSCRSTRHPTEDLTLLLRDVTTATVVTCTFHRLTCLARGQLAADT